MWSRRALPGVSPVLGEGWSLPKSLLCRILGVALNLAQLPPAWRHTLGSKHLLSCSRERKGGEPARMGCCVAAMGTTCVLPGYRTSIGDLAVKHWRLWQQTYHRHCFFSPVWLFPYYLVLISMHLSFVPICSLFCAALYGEHPLAWSLFRARGKQPSHLNRTSVFYCM